MGVILAFIGGLIFGGLFGVFLSALVIANRNDREDRGE